METKNWNVNDWENYLKEIESPQTELLLRNPNYVELMSEEQFREGVINLMGTNYYPQLNNIVSLLMDGLTEKQKNVLHYIFWESKTLREVANIMGIKHASVRDLRDRALISLSRIIISTSKRPQQNFDEAA